MKHYYFFDSREDFFASPVGVNGHYIDLPDGTVFAVIQFVDEAVKIKFEKDQETRHQNRGKKFGKLPHLLSRRPVAKEHADRLAHLGVTPNDNTFDLAEKIAQIAPLHGPDVL